MLLHSLQILFSQCWESSVHILFGILHQSIGSISPWSCLRNACIVASTPVSVPQSILKYKGITLLSYRYSRYQRPINLGSLLLVQTQSQSIFLLAMSILSYIASGKVSFWKPISLLCPSTECTQFGPLVVKGCFLFLTLTARLSSPSGSRSRGTFKRCSVTEKFAGSFKLLANSLLYFIKSDICIRVENVEVSKSSIQCRYTQSIGGKVSF